MSTKPVLRRSARIAAKNRSIENELFESRPIQIIDSRTKNFFNNVKCQLDAITSTKCGPERIQPVIEVLKCIDNNFDIAIKNERFVQVLHDKMIDLLVQLKPYYNQSLDLTKDFVKLTNRIHSRLHVMFGFEHCFEKHHG